MRICHFKSSTTKPTFVNASGAEGDCYSVATSPPLAEYLPSKVAADNMDLDLVVCTPTGTPTNKSNLRRTFKAITKKANLLKIRFHDMRHTHATLLLLQGVNPKIVSERLGHADVRITLDTYSHLLPSMQKETARNFGKMLFADNNSD